MMKTLVLMVVSLFSFAVSATDFFSLPETSGRSQKIKSMSRIEAALKDQQRVKIFNIALNLPVSAEESFTTRGASDAALFKKFSPAVVLLATQQGFGSGAIISRDGHIVTNWHVIAGNKEVAVMFKPLQEGKKPSSDDYKMAKVVRVDEMADLALLKIESIPSYVTPLELANKSDISIGLDVHAIGHPVGQSWTYTKGIISQYREDYDWGYEEKTKHKAAVIQTQTPINPGNSGGPLILDSGQLIGINSFKKAESEGLNYAVAVQEIEKLLSLKKDITVTKASRKKCDPKKLFEGRNKADDADIVQFDTDCNGKLDTVYVMPDDKKGPLKMYLLTKSDEAPNAVIYSFKRDPKFWELSYWDNELKGAWSVVGLHRGGDSVPYKFVSRQEYERLTGEQR
jgi:S1-C subfamily serine protease